MIATSQRDENGKRLKPDMSVGGRTKQSFKDEADINVIMANYKRTGSLTHISTQMPQYGDFSEVTDYQSAVNQVHEAQEEFMKLPSAIRNQMKNDPAVLLEFLDNPDNNQEAIDLGLREGKKTVVEAPVADPPTEAPPVIGGE